MLKHNVMAMFAVAYLMLVTLQICSCYSGHGAVRTIYVQPTDTDASSCSYKPCKTLAYYSNHPTQYFQSNTVVIFLDGKHHIDIGGLIPVRDVTNLEFRVKNFAEIICKNSTGFAFLNVSNLCISNIAFCSCGARVGEVLVKEVLFTYTNASQLFRMSERQQIAILLAGVYNLTVSSLIIQNSTGYGLLGFNVLGTSVIRNSKFSFNNYYTLNSQACQIAVTNPILYIETIQDCMGGNALFIFSELNECKNDQMYTLFVVNSTFSHGVDLTGSALIRKLTCCPNDNVVFGGAGISAKIAPTSYKLEIILDGVNTSVNNADSGPNMNFQTFDFIRHFALTIRNSVCELGNTLLSENFAYFAWPLNSGFYYYKGLKLSANYNPVCWTHSPEMTYKGQMNITNSSFTGNRGFNSGAMMFFFHPQYDYRVYEITNVDNCTFQNNLQGAIIVREEHGPIKGDVSPIQFTIRNSQFSYHSFFNKSFLRPFDTTFYAAVIFDSAQNVTIENSKFYSNFGPAIQAKHAILYMLGEILVWNNTGDIGAGISLLYSSYMVLHSNTAILFLENHAQSKGGAIYVQKSADEDQQACFFQVMNPNALKIAQFNVNILLINNTSGESGSAVYGGTVDNCTRKYVSDKPGPIAPWVYFDEIFYGLNGELIANDEEQPSLISSDPQQVCHCQNNTMLCPQDQVGELFRPVVVEKSVFPGALFQVMLATLGQRKGLVEGVIHAVSYPEPNKELPLGKFQATQSVHGCVPVSYQVFTPSPIAQFGLALDRAGEGIPYVSLDMHVTLLPCPPGFSITNALYCICAPPLAQRGLYCNITEQTIERKGTVWVSITSPGNESDSFLVHDHCPFDYCNTSTIKIVLSDPDEQCVYDRSGILCGQCKPGQSAIFGSSKCKTCNNRWISLLAVFIVAGIVLIAFLIFFNLTVSIGTVNGFILFANVVRVNSPTFFPPASVSPFLSTIRYALSLFIAWLNLDLGIELCFYDGMTTVDKVWLQFVFPLYIWALVGLIIYAARRSIFVVRIIGSSPISVLATLFLLSYAKLLQTIISIFSFTDLTFPDKSISPRWLLDGNIVMAEGKHIPLLVVALAFSVFFIIPFTLMLVFAPCIQAQTGTGLLEKRWIRSIIPLLDAYQIPYNANFRFWTGLLLVVRIVLFLAFSVNALGDPKINLLITVTMVIFLLALNLHLGYAYKNRLLNVIESSFIINLGVLSLWSSFITKGSTNSIKYQLIVTCLMVGLAFIKFILIFCYHVYLLLKRREMLHYFKCCCKCRHNGYEKLINKDDEIDKEPASLHSPPLTTTKIVLTDSLTGKN